MSANRTLNIKAGEYVGNYELSTSGILNYPIVLNPINGARIKGSLIIDGSHILAPDLDVFDTPDERVTSEPGSNPSFIEAEGLSLYGPYITVVHPKVQDIRSNGCGFWQSSYNAILYGLWTVNNGWRGPDRGHGHGLYTQNGASGYKTIRNCMWMQGYSGGLRAFTTNQELRDIAIDKCTTIFDSPFIGGSNPAVGAAMTNCRVWNGLIEIGMTDDNNDDIDVSGNYIVSRTIDGASTVIMRYWKRPDVQNNTLVLRSNTVTWQLIRHASPISEIIDNNIYYVPDLNALFGIIYPPGGGANYYTIAQWQALGYDVNSTFIEGLPTVNQIFVEHSAYNNDIAHVTIFNWEETSSVAVDFSGGSFTLANVYRAYNALNPDEYHEFTHDGNPVSIPMTGWTRATPVGDDAPLNEDTWPTFGAFVVKLAP